MKIELIDEGDLIQFDHPICGKGKGIVMGKDVNSNEVYVCPKKKSKYEKIFLTIDPQSLVLTPF